MGLTAAFLVSAIVPEGYLSTRKSFPLEFPAVCLWHPGREWAAQGVSLKTDGKPGFGAAFVSISVVWLVGSYVVRAFALFPRLLKPLEKAVEEGVGLKVEKLLLKWEDDCAAQEKESWGLVLKLKLALSVTTLAFSVVDFFGSMIWEVGFMMFCDYLSMRWLIRL